MGKELITVRDGPHDVKEYVEEFLKYSGPRPGRFVVTGIRGEVDVDYALKPSTGETLLREVRMDFYVSAVAVPEDCLQVDLHIRIAYDGEPHIANWKLTSTCQHGWFAWSLGA